LETKAKFIAQVMSGDMTIRRLEDLDSAALTYAEVKAIASGNPLVIEKAQVDAELIRLTRLRSAHAEEQYRIRTNLRRSHEDAEAFTGRLTNLRQDIAGRQDTSGDKFSIELDGQVLDNRGIAGELIVRRAEKIKNRFGDDVRIGRFAGFDLFLRPTFNNNVEMILRGRNSYAARVTDTAQVPQFVRSKRTSKVSRNVRPNSNTTSPTPPNGRRNWKAKSARTSSARSVTNS
jgi:hypothetical protein